MEGHFTDYLKKFQENYQKLRKQGKDLYLIREAFANFVIALPDEKRIIKRDGSVELTSEDISYIEELFPHTLRETSGEIEVSSYTMSHSSDHFSASDLEILLEGGKIKVYEIMADVDAH